MRLFVRVLFALALGLAATSPAYAASDPELGGTGASNTGADDTIMIGDGLGKFPEVAVPDCVGSGKALNYTASTNTPSCLSFQVGHDIEENATPLTAQPVLNFAGDAAVLSCVSSGGKITCTITAITALVEDTSPTLGGPLDLGDQNITNTTPTFTLTPTEISYLAGVTSAIQAQIDGKAASSHCANHASADLACSGETLVYQLGSVGKDELAPCSGSVAGEVLKYGVGTKTCVEFPSTGHDIEDETTPLTARSALNFTGAGVVCTDNAGTDATDCTIAGGGHTIEDEGTPRTDRATLNFVGLGVTCVDDAGNGETDCTIPGRHTIEEDGTPLTSRTSLNFAGSLVTCVDDAGGDKTTCTIAGATGHTIADEGTARTDRPTLNFLGAGVSCADNAGNNSTDCTIAGGGGGGSGGHTIEEEGSPLSARDDLNFTGLGILCFTADGNTTECNLVTFDPGDFDLTGATATSAGTLSLDPTRPIPALTRPQLADTLTQDSGDSFDAGAGILRIAQRADCSTEANAGSICVDNSGANIDEVRIKLPGGDVATLPSSSDDRSCQLVSGVVNIGTHATQGLYGQCTLSGYCKGSIWFPPSSTKPDGNGYWTRAPHDLELIGPFYETNKDVKSGDSTYCRFEKATADCDSDTADNASGQCWDTKTSVASCSISGTGTGNERQCTAEKDTRTTVVEGEMWTMLCNWTVAVAAADNFINVNWYVCNRGDNTVD